MFPIFIDSPSVRTTNRRRPNSPPRPVSPKPPESPRPSALGSPSPPSRAPPRRTPRPRANRFRRCRSLRSRPRPKARAATYPRRRLGYPGTADRRRFRIRSRTSPPGVPGERSRTRVVPLRATPGDVAFRARLFFSLFFRRPSRPGFPPRAPTARSLVARNANVGAILGEKPRRSKRERRRHPRREASSLETRASPKSARFSPRASAARRLRSRRRRRYESTRARDPKRRGDSSTRETRGEVWSTPPVASRRARETRRAPTPRRRARRVRLRRESRRATPIATWRTRGEPRGATWTFSRIGPRDDRRIRPIARLGRRE